MKVTQATCQVRGTWRVVFKIMKTADPNDTVKVVPARFGEPGG